VTPSKSAEALFVKPTGVARPTNMTVITDRRTYSFDLSVAPPRASSAFATWVLRFQIPPPPPTAALRPPEPISAVGKNADYSSTGSEAILPMQAFDDGARTYFAWAPEVAMPAIFAVAPDGGEGLVNFTMRDGFAVVQQTAGRFVLRQGASVATVTSTPGTHARTPARNAGERHDR
jgi:type IV secretion system protein VirB9